LTEHDDVIKSLLRGVPRLGLALGPATARAGPGNNLFSAFVKSGTIIYFRRGGNGCNLMYLTSKHVFQNFGGNWPVVALPRVA